MRPDSCLPRRSSVGIGCEPAGSRAPPRLKPREVSAVCLIVAGMVKAVLATEEFTISWTHSVEKTRWEETYRVDGDRLALIAARIQGVGAGMEAPPARVSATVSPPPRAKDRVTDAFQAR